MKFETDELLEQHFSRTQEKSTILMTLNSRLNYQDAKVANMYERWKKL